MTARKDGHGSGLDEGVRLALAPFLQIKNPAANRVEHIFGCLIMTVYMRHFCSARIFTELSPLAKEGDLFRIPFLPIVQVVRRFCVGDKVWLIVANSRGDRERWIVSLDGDRGSGRFKKTA